MTQEEKINYMRIAAGICGFGIDNKSLDLLVSLYELTMKKKGATKLDDIVDVKMGVENRAIVAKKQELLDYVSEKKE